jgi:undecaprenyl-diphosphatase
VLAALALGWGAAAAIHLAFGSPAGRPSVAQIEATLRELGVPATNVALEPRQPQGATCLDADGLGGRLRIKVLGRDETEAQLFSKVWRSLLYKESGRTMQLTRLQQVEHEAYVVLAARSAGVRAPELVAAGMAGPGAAVLVLRDPMGTPLTDVQADTLTEDVLAGVWEQAGRLHAARLVHGQLNTAAVIVTPEGPAITGFGLARTSRSGRDQSADVAELLASLSGLVGPDRALNSALAGVGAPRLIRALPFLQPPALSATTRAALGSRAQRKGVLAHLREAGAAGTGTKPPALQQLHRISSANLVLAVGAFLAVSGLLSTVGSPSQLLAATRQAQWGWLAVAFAAVMATNFPAAVALLGTVTHGLPLWPTVELQVGLSFSNVAVPLGGTAMQVRFLQHQGSELGEAIAAGGLLSTVGNAVGWGLVLVVALLLSPRAVHIASLPKNLPAIALIAVLGLGVVAAIVLGLPMLRRTVIPSVAHAAAEVWAAVRSPRRLGLLLGGNSVVGLLLGLSLSACLVAFGAHASVWSVIALDLGISSIAALVPIPGGGTAVSAVGMSAGLVALGVAQEAAIGAVLANQIVATYLPAIPGWFATRDLAKRDWL